MVGQKRILYDLQHEATYRLTSARAVWLESSLTVWRNFASLAIKNVPSEDSDQTAQMRSLIWIFTGRNCQKVHCLTLRFIFYFTAGVSRGEKTATSGCDETITTCVVLLPRRHSLQYKICFFRVVRTQQEYTYMELMQLDWSRVNSKQLLYWNKSTEQKY